MCAESVQFYTAFKKPCPLYIGRGVTQAEAGMLQINTHVFLPHKTYFQPEWSEGMKAV